jgi:hypothetical protein
MHTQAIQCSGTRETSFVNSITTQDDVSWANALTQTGDTSECSVRLVRVLRCDEFLCTNRQASHHSDSWEIHTALPRKSRALAFLSLFSDGR